MKINKIEVEYLTVFIKIVFYILLLILSLYIIILIQNKYIFSFKEVFSLDVTYQISAFLGVILSSIFSVVNAYLLCINFIEFRKINSLYFSNDRLEKERETQELISKLGEKYFKDTQTSFIDLAVKGVFIGTENCIHYLQKPYRENIDKNNITHNRAFNNYESNQIIINLHLHNLEVISEDILNSGIDLTEFRYSLISKFIDQTGMILIFLTICRNANKNFGNSIIELYEKWGGQTGDIMERILTEEKSS
jgi:hypothetical protein